MIRDPSDGSIREIKKIEIALPNSSLAPSKETAAEAAKLEKSREWLRERAAKMVKRGNNAISNT